MRFLILPVFTLVTLCSGFVEQNHAEYNADLVNEIPLPAAPEILQFPDNFKFGSASAAYQIEGAWNIDGRGPSIWDTFTHNYPERIADGQNGDDAAKSYFLYPEDVSAMSDINAQFYRFSVSWSRVLPSGGIESRNQLGIDYYNRVIDELLANGIQPVITMYHWDMPQAIQDQGGLTSPIFVEYFEDYADLLYTEFGDRVKEWITFNEPFVHCSLGYAEGSWPPALNDLGTGDYHCAHYTILSHARAYRLYREKYYAEQNGRVGITLNINYAMPEDPNNPSHVEAQNRYMQFMLGIYTNPLILGDYPPLVREIVDRNSAAEGLSESRLLNFSPEEVDMVKGSLDFLGINYYTSVMVIGAEENVWPTPSLWQDIFCHTWADPSWPRAKSSWLYSIPEGFYGLMTWIRDHYDNIEVLITENGWSDDGELNDEGRITYLRDHLAALHRAIQDGCNITAHATWSIVDNFEWLMGYTEKFGIYRVDINDPERVRVQKDSARFLRDIFQTRQLVINN